MSENLCKASFVGKPKQTAAVRKGPLSVINGDIAVRKRITRKQNGRIVRTEKVVFIPHLSQPQPFEIFKDAEDENESRNGSKNAVSNANDKETVENESCNGSKNIVNNANDKETVENESALSPSSSPDFIGLSPEAQKETLFSYSKKVKEAEYADLLWYSPYREDIHNYFKEVERNFLANPNYMEKQQDLNLKMRRILIDWCVEVVEEYNLQMETLYLTVSYIDRFLSHVAVLRGKLQLVGTASLFLASKYEEIYPPELKDFVFITDNTYSKQQILRMEHLILKVLNFDLCIPTAYTFLQLYLTMCNASDGLKHLSQYVCEVSLLDGEHFLKYVPSVIAAGSIALSYYILGVNMWDETMENITGYKLTDLYHLCEFLFDKLIQMPTSTENSMYGKYQSPKYGSASLIECPDVLVFPYSVEKCSCIYC